MKPFYLILTGASLLSLVSAHAEPTNVHEAFPSSFSLFSEENELISASTIDEELSLLDEEMEEFEDEILALEEELKRDAESSYVIEPKASITPAAVEEPQVTTLRNSAEELDDKVVFTSFTDEVEDFSLEQPVNVETPTLSQNELPRVEVAAEPVVQIATKEEEIIPQSTLNDEMLIVEQPPIVLDTPAILNIETNAAEKKNDSIEVNLQQAFAGSPLIYTILFAMSVFALCIWLYSYLTLRKSGAVSTTFLTNLKNKLNSNHFDDALSLCQHQENLFGKMVERGINARRHGLPVMIEAMKAEGKRASVHYWQRIGLLNDIAVIAPMLGLLGTVLGMFYAFYDINRSIESISTLFDGLGVSVGTTVAGLVVAILALMLHSIAKYRLVKALAYVENEAQSLANLIDDRTSEYKG